MRLSFIQKDDLLLEEIGRRLAGLRLARNWTQRDLAVRAGVSLRTVQRLEKGEAGPQLPIFLRLCRELELLAQLDTLLPEPVPGPMDQLRRKGKLRQRASGTKAAAPPAKSTWQWGEDS